MPRVKSFTAYFGKQLNFYINVDKTGVFSISLPEFAVPVLGVKRVCGGTLAEVERLFEAERQRYLAIQTHKKRVILLRFAIQNRDVNHVKLEGQRDDISFCVGTGVVFAVGNAVAEEHINSEGMCYRTSYSLDDKQPYPACYTYGDHLKLANSDDARVLPWSLDAEKWFVDFCNRFSSLVALLQSLDEDQTALANVIQHKQVLLEVKTFRK